MDRTLTDDQLVSMRVVMDLLEQRRARLFDELRRDLNGLHGEINEDRRRHQAGLASSIVQAQEFFDLLSVMRGISIDNRYRAETRL